jgi:hypothetical protein
MAALQLDVPQKLHGSECATAVAARSIDAGWESSVQEQRQKYAPSGAYQPLTFQHSMSDMAMLKNPVIVPNGQNLGDRKCLAIREDRL